MDSIIVRAYKSSQGSIPFYLFLINSIDLLHISYVVLRAMTLKRDSKNHFPRAINGYCLFC